jgi:hypothetical protein
MEILALILTLLIFTFFTASLVVFLDFCMNEGNIFDKYYIFILKYENIYPNIFKLLGGCIYCFGTWIYIGMFLLFAILLNFNILFLFLGIGSNYFFIKLIKCV